MPTEAEAKAAAEAAAVKAQAEAQAKAVAEAEAKAAAEAAAKAKAAEETAAMLAASAKRNPEDPVKLKCLSVSGTGSGAAPKELHVKFENVPYTIPVGGEMKGTMPRRGAEFLIQKAARYATMRAELVIVEPKF